MKHPLPCMYCYMNVRKKANYKGHRGYVRPRRRALLRVWETDDMKRPECGPGGPTCVPSTGELLAGLTSLFEQLTAAHYDDGTPRKRSTLTVFCDGADWKVTLNERDTERVAFQTGVTVEECLLSLDDALRRDRVSWRQSSYPTGAKRKSA